MFGFGKDKASPADALYREQNARDVKYTQTHEYRTIYALGE